jgi:competence protein ComEC
MLSQINSSFVKFWEKHPALLIGIILLIGTAFSFHHEPIELCLLLGFIVPIISQTKSWKVATFLLLIFAIGWASACYRAPLITLPHPKMEGIARFAISAIKPHQSPFHRSLVYRGELVEFRSGEIELRGIPCLLYLPFSKERPTGDRDYFIRGTLIQKEDRRFTLKPEKRTPWVPVPSTFHFAELRYCAKQKIQTFLNQHLSHPSVATFLNALATGEVDERNLAMEFGRVGLQHILAISGFHFALIALFFNFILQLFLPPRFSSLCLILLLSIYYLFLGDSPSVQRAWIAITALLVGKAFNRQTNALNALGVGLCAEILLDPTVISHTGFILSFLSTGAILQFVPLVRPLCEFLLPIRCFSNVKSMPSLDRWGYLIGSLLRQSLMINTAVHLVCLPVLLFLFHRFPLLSFAYNLFFPFWVSISLLLLCTACLLILLAPPLGHFLFFLVDRWTNFVLNATSHPPAFLDFVIRIPPFSYSTILILLFLFFIISISYADKKSMRHLAPVL